MEYLEEIRKHFTLPVTGDIRSFRDIFALLLDLSRRERFTLIIDEFQEFLNINPAVYSEVQKLWDLNKSQCRMNLICIGSIYYLMHRIFEEPKEPLFGRADRIITLKAFSISDTWTVLEDHECHDPQNLFDVYLMTRGMPKYLDLLTANAALTKGNKNEIDLIAVNDLEKKLVIAEVKLNRARIDLTALKAKAGKLLSSYPGYHFEWLALGLEDIGEYIL